MLGTNEKRHLNVGMIEITNRKCEKLLGIKIDSKLLLDSDVKFLWKKVSQKLNVLSRVAHQLDFNQRKLLLNAFVTSQFPYALVVWMFHNRKQNHHRNRIYRIVYKDHNSSFDELLEKANSCEIRDRNLQKPSKTFRNLQKPSKTFRNLQKPSKTFRNLQKLETKIFKVKINLAPEKMKEVFEIVEGPYALRNKLKLKLRKIDSVRYGTETASSAGARVWSSLSSDLEECKSLELFKSRIKILIPENCPCKLSKTYLQGIAYVKIAI